MRRKTYRETIIEIVSDYSKITAKECYEAIKKLGYKTATLKEVEGIVRDAKYANTSAVARYRDIGPDNHIYNLDDAEKKGKIKLAVLSDTHFASKHQNLQGLEDFVNIALNEGVSHFICPGDLLEGMNVYPGQLADITSTSQEDQIMEVLKKLPVLPGKKKYWWISGNHDLCWLKQSSGFDPLVAVSEARKDFNYMGKWSAYVCPSKNVTIQLVHPDRGGGINPETAARRFVNNLSPDRVADITLFGHWHACSSFRHRNSFVELCPSFQGVSNLSVRNGWGNVTGGLILDIELGKDGKIKRYRNEKIIYSEDSLATLERKSF